MKISDLLKKYLDKKIDAIALIRLLTGMFNPDHAINLLTIVNQITRHEQGDLDTETFRSVWKLDKPEGDSECQP
jgi:hypothetical protein